MDPTYYCVQQFTVSSKICTCSTFPCCRRIVLRSVLPFIPLYHGENKLGFNETCSSTETHYPDSKATGLCSYILILCVAWIKQ